MERDIGEGVYGAGKSGKRPRAHTTTDPRPTAKGRPRAGALRGPIRPDAGGKKRGKGKERGAEEEDEEEDEDGDDDDDADTGGRGDDDDGDDDGDDAGHDDDDDVNAASAQLQVRISTFQTKGRREVGAKK